MKNQKNEKMKKFETKKSKRRKRGLQGVPLETAQKLFLRKVRRNRAAIEAKQIRF